MTATVESSGAQRARRESIESVLQNRRQAHGDWQQGAIRTQDLKRLCRLGPRAPKQAQEGLDAICVKITRIVIGDPCLLDHWRDIEGYARLVKKALKENYETAKL